MNQFTSGTASTIAQVLQLIVFFRSGVPAFWTKISLSLISKLKLTATCYWSNCLHCMMVEVDLLQISYDTRYHWSIPASHQIASKTDSCFRWGCKKYLKSILRVIICLHHKIDTVKISEDSKPVKLVYHTLLTKYLDHSKFTSYQI